MSNLEDLKKERDFQANPPTVEPEMVKKKSASDFLAAFKAGNQAHKQKMEELERTPVEIDPKKLAQKTKEAQKAIANGENPFKNAIDPAQAGLSSTPPPVVGLPNNNGMPNLAPPGTNPVGTIQQPQAQGGQAVGMDPNGNQQAPQPQQSTIFSEENVIKGFSMFAKFLGAFVKSFGKNEKGFALKYGNKLMVFGAVQIGVALTMGVLGMMISREFPFELISFGMLMVVVGLIVTTRIESAEEKVKREELRKVQESSVDKDIDFLTSDGTKVDLPEQPEGVDEFIDEVNSEQPVLQEEDNYDNPFEVSVSADATAIQQAPKQESFKDAYAELERMTDRVLSRTVIFEKFSRYLEKGDPNYNVMKTYGNDDVVTLRCYEFMRESSDLYGLNDIPLIHSVSESKLFTKVECDRIRDKSKVNDVVLEFVKLYDYAFGSKRDDADLQGNYSVSQLGSKMFITIRKDFAFKSFLGDLFFKDKDFYLGNATFPLVLGTDIDGGIVHLDFEKVESMLSLGIPRSGKSTFVLHILAQLTMFSSSDQIRFYISDTKGTSSTYADLDIPHIVGFKSTKEDIIALLRYIVKDLAPRKREQMASSSGAIKPKKIQDYNKRNPDNIMAYDYLIMDELVTFMGLLNPEERREVDSLLKSITTELPSIGIRLILIPHRLNNEIISKTVYSNIAARFGFMVGTEEGKKIVDSSSRFNFNLPNKGDAVSVINEVNNGNPFFLHSPLLADNDTGEGAIFKLIKAMWKTDDTRRLREEVEKSIANYKTLGDIF